MREPSIRASVLGNITLQLVLVAASAVLWLAGEERMVPLQLLYVASLAAIAVYLKRVPFPGLVHWFCLCYAALFYLYPLVLPLLGFSLGAPSDIVLAYTFLTVGGIHIFLVAYELSRSKRSLCEPPERYAVELRRLSRVVWALLIANAAGVLLIVLDAGPPTPGTLRAMIAEQRVERKETAGALSNAGLYFINLGAVGFALLPAYLSMRRRHTLLAVAIVCATDLFLVLAFRVRAPVAMHMVALAVGQFVVRPRLAVLQRSRIAGERSVDSQKAMWKMGIALVLVACLGLYIRAVRSGISDATDASFLRHDLMDTIELALAIERETGGDFSYTPNVLKVLQIVPDSEDYLLGQSYYRLLFVPIPRPFWPNKPLNTGIIVGRWILPDSEYYSNTPGFMGDLYINFGFAGILGFAVFGLAFAQLDSSRRLRHVLLVAVSFSAIFQLTRGAFTNTVIQMAVFWVGAAIAERHLLTTRARAAFAALMPGLRA